MQAALITAYKDERHLKWLVGYLSTFMKVYVHLDRKCRIEPDAVSGANVTVIKRYRIGWGYYEHLLAVLDLMRLAVEDPQVDYIHVISGQDMPLHGSDWFASKFGDSRSVYMSCLESCAPNFRHDWIDHYFLTTHLDKRKLWVHLLNRGVSRIQDLLGIRRQGLGGYRSVFKGLVYVSMPSVVARYVLRQFDANAKLRFDCRHTIVPEEFFFQTVVMNSPFASKAVRDDLRYCDWGFRNGSEPAYLDETDFAVLRGGAMPLHVSSIPRFQRN